MKFNLVLLLAFVIASPLAFGDTTEAENKKLRERLEKLQERTKAINAAIDSAKKEIAEKRLQIARLSGAEATPKPVPLPQRNTIATLREKISSTTWKFSKLKFGFNDKGTVIGYLGGGRWKIMSASKINVYDRKGKFRVSFTFNDDYSKSTTTWASGAGGPAKRIK